MAILHKNITATADIHNPKWFTDANNGDYAFKNEKGELESIDELLLPAALNFVDGSVAPPTTSTGDIYILSSGGSVNAGWGSVALQDWVRYDGTAWNSITPQKSSLCYDKTADSLMSFNGTAWAAIGGGGGGGGNTIYTANDSLTGNRVVTQGGNSLDFVNTNFKAVFSTDALGLYDGATQHHNIQTNGGGSAMKVKFNKNGGTSQFIVNGNSVVGTEKISLQAHTLAKGADTLSTSSALQIYDGDSTPNLLWDFRNNGDLLKGDTILKIGDSNVISGSGTHRFIYGTGNNINGTSKIWQFCVGVDNELSGSNHGAFGRLNSTTGLGTQYAFGSKNTLNGSYTFSFGGDNVTSANFTNTFGMATKATAIGASVIGYGDSTNFANKLVNSTTNSLALGWNTTTPQHLFKSDGVNLTLPTSASGLSSGDLYNDGGTVKIV